jgi:hypothetical protein
MKKIIAFLLTLAMLLSLAACGDKESDPDAGVYICTTAEMMGMQMPIEEIYEGENSLELKSGGKGTLTLEGDSYKVKWELDGTELTVTVDGEESVGSLKNGVIEIDMMGMGLVLTFVKEETDALANKNGALAGSIKDRLDDGAEDKALPGAASELGLYYGTTYAYNDQTFNMTDIYNSLCSLELLEGGKAVFGYDDAYITYNDGTSEEAHHDTDLSDYGGGKDYWGFQHVRQIKQFYDALSGKAELDISGERALKTHRLVMKIYEIGKKQMGV